MEDSGLLYSMKLDIPYKSSMVSEIKTFREDSMSHTTIINGTEVVIKVNEEFTGVTIETFNDDKTVAKGNLYLPFPQLDQVQDPFSFPNLFKLNLKTTKLNPTPLSKIATPKTILLRDVLRGGGSASVGDKSASASASASGDKFATASATTHIEKQKNLFNLGEESKKNISSFTCDVQQNTNKSQFSSCIHIACASTNKKNIYLCGKCKGKLAECCSEYKCIHDGCKYAQFIEDNGSTSSKFCKKHGI